jgi:hypothetical protein
MGKEPHPSHLPSPSESTASRLRQTWDAFRARERFPSPTAGTRHEYLRPSPAALARPVGTATLIFLGCLVAYHVNGRNQSGVDTIPPTYTAWAIAQHGSLDLSRYPELQRYVGVHIHAMADGRWLSIRPPGSALAAVPIMAPFVLFNEQPLREVDMNHLGKLAGAVWTSAAVVVFFFLSRRLAPAAAWPATILFAFGTCLWSVAAQALWMHGPATFWVCLGLYLLAAPGTGPGFGAGFGSGLALGLAVLTRPTTALFGIATGLALLGQRRWRGVVGLALGAVLPLGGYCLFGWLEFGDGLRGGYTYDIWHLSPPFWLGFGGLLVAPSRGLLVYCPALLLLPLGVVVLWRMAGWRRVLFVSWLLAALATIVFYARWHDWTGGWCFGPRFLCEILPICCLIFALGHASLKTATARHFATVLIGLSILVHVAGVFGRKAETDWCSRHDIGDEGWCMFQLNDTQIEAYARSALEKVTGE